MLFRLVCQNGFGTDCVEQSCEDQRWQTTHILFEARDSKKYNMM